MTPFQKKPSLGPPLISQDASTQVEAFKRLARPALPGSPLTGCGIEEAFLSMEVVLGSWADKPIQRKRVELVGWMSRLTLKVEVNSLKHYIT